MTKRGGARKGAGRKSSGRVSIHVLLAPAAIKIMRKRSKAASITVGEYIEQLLLNAH